MLSKATEYAIRALVYISLQNTKGQRPGFREIAREINSPEHFTAKILQSLTKRGLLQSMKGRGGGFFLYDSPLELTLYDVINVMEGHDFFIKCGFGMKNCNENHPCPLHNEYTKIRDTLRQVTESTSILELARRVSNNEAILVRKQ